MKQYKKRFLTVCVLAVCMALILSVGAFAAPDGEQSCTLKLNRPITFTDTYDQEDIAKAGIVIDLYKVADAVPDEVYDTYGYEAAEGFADVVSAITGVSDWTALAQTAAAIVLDGNAGIEPTTVELGATAENLDQGLYLVVAHGGVDDYVVKTTAEGEEAVATYTTIAQTPEYEYVFSPYLVSLPSRNASLDAEGVMTSDTADWEYELTGTLKMEQNARMGDLRVTKTVAGYNPAVGGLFVFRVTAVHRGETVYSNVVAIDYAKGETEFVLENAIPAGSEVTVEEIYTGPAYVQTGASEMPVTVSVTETAQVGFENAYTGSGVNSGGILNRFAYNNSGWEWLNDPAQAQ